MNPNKYIRKAIIDAVETATGWPAFDYSVPVDLDPQPKNYILVKGTTKNRFADSKSGHEWICATQVDIVSIQEKGYVSSEVVDDKEGEVQSVVPAIKVDGYITKFTRILDSRTNVLEYPAQTVVRTVLMYEQWLGQAELNPTT